jgi:hypothetical protein
MPPEAGALPRSTPGRCPVGLASAKADSRRGNGFSRTPLIFPGACLPRRRGSIVSIARIARAHDKGNKKCFDVAAKPAYLFRK